MITDGRLQVTIIKPEMTIVILQILSKNDLRSVQLEVIVLISRVIAILGSIKSPSLFFNNQVDTYGV